MSIIPRASLKCQKELQKDFLKDIETLKSYFFMMILLA